MEDKTKNGDALVSKTYINQGSLSNKLGWSEATGRKWITKFQEFIPPKIEGNKKMYDESAYKVLVIIKNLSDKKFSSSQILEIFREMEYLEQIKKLRIL